MAISDLFELRTTSTFLGQVCYNVYFYAVSAEGGVFGNPAQRLADAWNIFNWEDSGSLFRSTLFSNDLNYSAINTRALFNPALIYELLLGTYSGENADVNMPPYVAFTLRSDRTDGRIRRGFKRFPGVVESANANGNVEAAALAGLVSLGEQLVGELTYGDETNFITFSPVVVKRVKYTEDGVVKYRLPESVGEAVYSQIMTWDAIPTLTTQNSRKYGVGV